MDSNSFSSEGAVTALHTAVLTAWNTRDAAAFAALFADHGLLIGFDGSQVPAAEIPAHLEPIFSGHATAAYVWKVREVRPLADRVALLSAIAGMLPPGAEVAHPALNAVQSLVAVRAATGWRVALLQNTPAQYHERPDLAEAHTAELAGA
ncbi:SgcJ/EcaC family oxidoreductase [Catenuloplanes japonicus]|uniref:SgcJ/EcaC family oxidoreductase n=1 Tax=Catenuloplanes japonicus TaxID=33876 RepID=UPI000526E630|nr:SgcJ/EcaC family oxidoreductase [Catenuloplanes japonicus]